MGTAELKNMKKIEILAVICVIGSLLAIPIGIVRYQQSCISRGDSKSELVFTLTGVGKDSVWTLETVNAENYWRKTFTRATFYLTEGDYVKLRLQSADVHHRFYAPALDIGPIDVEAGHTKTVSFHAKTPGKYRYYCTSICGECHFYMQGWIIVSAKGTKAEEIPVTGVTCIHELKEPSKDNMIEWGHYLYKKLGCETCHGVEGSGGVKNFNYIRKNVPNHKTLAKRLFLEEKEDVDEFIKLITTHANLKSSATSTDIPRFPLVLAQYKAARGIIKNGKQSGKLDPNKPQPPLNMPSWKEKLTKRDIDSIIAYLLTLYPWNETEE